MAEDPRIPQYADERAKLAAAIHKTVNSSRIRTLRSQPPGTSEHAETALARPAMTKPGARAVDRTSTCGATSQEGMDRTRDKHRAGRQSMIAAFADLTTVALRAGVDEDTITDLHGRFFDGNVQAKNAFGVAVLMAEIWRPRRNAPRSPLKRPTNRKRKQ